jgi:hypothetical protein
MTVSRFRSILYTLAAIVSLAGLTDATYLAVQALTGETLVCGGSPDCFRVLGSSYAKVGGIPLALFGTLAYFSVFSFATFAVFGSARARTFVSHSDQRCDVSRYALAAVCAGLPAPRVLSLLSLLGGGHIPARRVGDCSSAFAGIIRISGHAGLVGASH